ncbi:lantibiotic dehydratase [Taibaiella chishuiensis]|uniref:Thiopeptide-type bacteriocin biosynthesis protein n=1 Tax=Taibaiella chishuiensis TaxID=1434707 RepID=A0A2P8D0Q9_9BACT|nr:lantibiotic dehydratase [Taibaiella chishuiensis]PSK90811.1 thiopeptide-type bacteriocin biosynthesis protein [Taibaiella chishuiensis]
MKLKIEKTVLYRIPKFPIDAELKWHWEDLKDAISISSKDFYKEIKDITAEELKGLSPKVLFSIFKYFNRARLRAVPYGTFASIGISEISNDFSSGILLKDQQEAHEFVDWAYQNDPQFSFSTLLAEDGLVISNSSYYRIDDIIRYIYKDSGTFELTDIGYDKTIETILNACRIPIRFSLLRNEVDALGLSWRDLHLLINELVNLQLIFSDQHRNIVGIDFFQRNGITLNKAEQKYIISQRAKEAGHLPADLFKALPQLTEILQDISGEDLEPNLMKKFKQSFRRKYDQKEVSLLEALDPELGIEYGTFAQTESTEFKVTDFIAKEKNNLEDVDLPLKSLLIDRFNDTEGFQRKVILLDDHKFKPGTKKTMLPNSFSAMLSVSDGLIQIDHLGGCTANALAGRFTLASNELLNFCRDIANIESQSNPEVIFFDIAYMAEVTVDNVNRRKSIYEHQLNIQNYSACDAPVSLNDLVIRLQGDELILRSKINNKRVIPRLASAYNYSRSDLPAFRFLCDLQHQGIQSGFSIRIQNSIPNLKFYPRVQYKNIIVSPASWKIVPNDFLEHEDEQQNIDACTQYLKDIGIGAYFKTGQLDQTLCFNVNNASDIRMFIQYSKKVSSLYIEEALIPDRSPFFDRKGKQFCGQVLLTMTHTEEIYKDVSIENRNLNITNTPAYPPAYDWLYFEIYCHPQRADGLLLEPISRLLRNYKAYIESWFFIRYNENGDHIRLRVKFKKFSDGQKIIQALNVSFAKEFALGIISDLQVKTYRREVERYGNDLIDLVESHFQKDSAYVLILLRQSLTDQVKYRLCSQFITAVAKEVFQPQDNFHDTLKKMRDSFNKEHSMNMDDFKKANRYYSKYLESNQNDVNRETNRSCHDFKESFKDTLRDCALTRRYNLFTDLFHMHVNRLFNSNQRTHEMLIYNFMLKDLQRESAFKMLRK